MSTPRRNVGLDVLRCVAILVVLANHAFLGLFIPLAGSLWEGRAAMLSIGSLISIEWLFVLSGFLIGTMMIRAFDADGTFWGRARSFWLRRWFRTLPNYYLFFVVNALIFALGWYPSFAAGAPRWHYLLFAQNLAWPERLPYFFNEAWSLALDEWFYLLMPLLIGAAFLVAKAGRRAAFLSATAVLILVPTVLRFFVPLHTDEPLEWDHQVRRVTILHLDATGWGVLAAVANRWHPAFWQQRLGWKLAAGVALMLVGLASIQALFAVPPVPAAAVLAAWPRFPSALAFTCTGLGTFLALPAIARLPSPSRLLRSGVEALSNYTYSIYLSHFPVLYVLSHFAVKLLGDDQFSVGAVWALTVLWLALTLLVSMAVHYAFEKPVSDLRERFTRRVDASPFGPATPP